MKRQARRAQPAPDEPEDSDSEESSGPVIFRPPTQAQLDEEELKAVRFIKTPHRCEWCHCVILQQTSAVRKGAGKKGDPDDDEGAGSRRIGRKFECSNCDAKTIGQTPHALCCCGGKSDLCGSQAAALRLRDLPFERIPPEIEGRFWFEPIGSRAYFDVEVRLVRGIMSAVFREDGGISMRPLSRMHGRWAGPLPLPIQ